MCTYANLNFRLQGLGFGSMLLTAYIFFVTLYFPILITLNTVTPGGRYNDGCFQKLSQTFIFHREAEKSLCPNSKSPVAVQISSVSAMGLRRVCSKQINKSHNGTEALLRFLSQNHHSSFMHGGFSNNTAFNFA